MDKLKNAAIGAFYGLAIISIPYFLGDMFFRAARLACG